MEGKTISLIAKDATINELNGDELFLVVSDNTNKAVTTNTISEFCNKLDNIILYVSKTRDFIYYPVKIIFGDIIIDINNLPYTLSDDIFNKIDSFIKLWPNIYIYTTDNILLYMSKNNAFKLKMYLPENLSYDYGNYIIDITIYTTTKMLYINLTLAWDVE